MTNQRFEVGDHVRVSDWSLGSVQIALARPFDAEVTGLRWTGSYLGWLYDLAGEGTLESGQTYKTWGNIPESALSAANACLP